MLLKVIKYLSLFGIFFFPFAIFKSLAFPLAFSHAVFLFTIIELVLFLFLLSTLDKGELVIKKSYLTAGLAVYIVILFITALTGSEFSLSFWSSYLRITGIITWLHFSIFYIIASAVFTEEKDWRNIFRALAASGSLLAIFSFLGVDGFSLPILDFLKLGGSFLGNTSYSGSYMLLIFFFSVIGFMMEGSRKWRILYIFTFIIIFFNPDLFNFGVLNGSVSFIEALKNPMILVGIARTSALVLWSGILLTGAIFIVNILKNKKTVIIVLSGLLVVLFGIYIYGFSSLISGEGKLHDFYVKQSGPMRPMVWNMAVQGIKEKPILGYGDGNFKDVYQNYVETEMIHLENPPWFDRVHNFTLEEFIGHGTIGAATLFVLFILIVFISFKLYLDKGKIYFLLIPFIFFLHFLQMQTFFQIDSTLFTSFLLLAFLVSHQTFSTFQIPWRKHTSAIQVCLAILVFIAFLFFVYFPIKENRLIPLIKNTSARSERLKLQKGLDNLTINPVETLRQTSKKFMNETANRAQEIQKAGFVKNVADEYQTYLNAYEKYLPKYSDSHRYLFEYANLINTAFIFGIQELAQGEELARESLEISKAFPYSYWVLAVNLYYQGRNDEALSIAKDALDLDPTIERSKQIYDKIQNNIKIKNKSFIYLYDI